ncbi:MAG: peptide deformylase [Anaerolineae bacterium]|nr:peptide deformylase [Anaerolineae bacterium]
MAIREILQIGHPTLRERSHKVTHFGDGLAALVEDMIETIHEAHGVGLAAPQIGVSHRVIVVEMPDDESYPYPGERWVVCNPEIVKASRETEIDLEGCLSVAGYVGMVERASEVVIRGQDLRGRKVRIKADGYLARAFQHEIDHLNGVLYVDIAEGDSVMTVEAYEAQAAEAGGRVESGAEPEAGMPTLA